MDNNYLPQPISVEDVQLSDELLSLTEALAKNVHEVWAQSRMNEGWTWGEQRDDEHKKHPCLVPYEQLSDGEKQYDRDTAMNTLKLIVKLGYRVDYKG